MYAFTLFDVAIVTQTTVNMVGTNVTVSGGGLGSSSRLRLRAGGFSGSTLIGNLSGIITLGDLLRGVL